ncbi:Cerevisin [Yarrowia sp. C11]|nr:Cerevisin [Yarrowia sp. C11]
MKHSLLLATLISTTLASIPANNDAIVFDQLLVNDLAANTPGNECSAKYEQGPPSLAPLYENDRDHVPNAYIITLKNANLEALETHLSWLRKVLESANIGFSGVTKTFSVGSYNAYAGVFAPTIVDLIRSSPLVSLVERDSIVHAYKTSEEVDAPWGLARLSHRDKLNLGSFNRYIYESSGGKGVTAYVIDTGVFIGHEDFDGRAKWGKTVPSGDTDEDANGHGTHCAGTIAGTKYGVAKQAEIVAVKVLRSDGSGTMSDVIGGVVYAATEHGKRAEKPPKGWKGSTANMSLGGGVSPSLNLAVDSAVNAGIHFAVAAGNDNSDACDYSPASSKNAITVGASTLSDSRAYFSNKGKCVDVFGPGLNILSTYIGSKNTVATLSGTSMASPHIAGLLTYFLSLQPDSDSAFATSVTPAQLKKNLLSFASRDILTDVGAESPNLLAYNGGGKSLKKFWGKGDSVTVKLRKLLFGF